MMCDSLTFRCLQSSHLGAPSPHPGHPSSPLGCVPLRLSGCEVPDIWLGCGCCSPTWCCSACCPFPAPAGCTCVWSVLQPHSGGWAYASWGTKPAFQPPSWILHCQCFLCFALGLSSAMWACVLGPFLSCVPQVGLGGVRDVRGSVVLLARRGGIMCVCVLDALLHVSAACVLVFFHLTCAWDDFGLGGSVGSGPVISRS